MSKIEQNLQDERKAKVLAARRRMREREEEVLNKEYDGIIDKHGAPIVYSYGLSAEDVLKDED
jgi:hypothetical protein